MLWDGGVDNKIVKIVRDIVVETSTIWVHMAKIQMLFKICSIGFHGIKDT
jgi:hypothetical protein